MGSDPLARDQIRWHGTGPPRSVWRKQATGVGDHEIPQFGGVGDHVIPPPGDHVIPHGDDVRVGAGSGPRRPASSALVAEQRGMEPDVGEEDLRRDRHVMEILIHWYAGRSQHELAASLGVDRKTLRKYTAPAGRGGDRAGRPADGRGRLARAGDGLVPGAGRYRAAAGVLAADRAAPRLHRRPAQGGGDGRRRSTSGCATSTGWTRAWRVVRRWVRANLPEEARRAQVTVLRDTAAAR